MGLKGFVSVILGVLVFSTTALGGEFLYKSTNKIDFIKIDKASKQEREGGIKHPYEFGPEEIRALLRSLHFNKKIILLKDIENRQLFDEGNVEFLAPYLIEAFKKVKPEEAVVVSYFSRDSKFLVMNDRLTVFRAFIKDDGLHFRFSKLYAKMLGDRTTMGAERAASEARGLRVALELQPGQNRISHKPEEIVFDLNYFKTGALAASAEEAPKKGKEKKGTSSPQTASASEAQKSVRERLKELEQLRKDEMITEKEYQKKRRELIKEL